MGILWQFLIAAVALLLVFYFVRSQFRKREPAQTVEDPDPQAGVPSTKKRGPPSRSGAVALAEPDDQDEDHTYPPRVG